MKAANIIRIMVFVFLIAGIATAVIPNVGGSSNSFCLHNYDRGRKGFRLSPLRTVQAGLPHTALQSVVILSELTEQFMDCGIGEQSLTL